MMLPVKSLAGISRSARNVLFPFLCIILAILAFSPTTSVAALGACETEYQAALATIKEERLDRGSHQKLESHVENAWRMHLRDNGDAVHQLDVALQMLDGEPTKRVPADVVQRLRQRVASMRTCIAKGTTDTATLVVLPVLLDETAVDLRGEPAGPGVYVRLNGENVGRTGDDGRVTLSVPSGTVEVTAVVPATAIGTEVITLAPGETREVKILLDDGKEVTEDANLLLDQVDGGVLPHDFAAFTLRFDGNGQPVSLSGIDYIDILDPKGGAPTEITHLFTLEPTGAIVASNLDTLRGMLAQRSNELIEIRVQAHDAEGFAYDGTIGFRLGRFRIEGTLVPPPSNPSLNVAGIEVTVSLLGTDVVIRRTSDEFGRFEIDAMPLGNIAFDSSTSQSGTYYYGQGMLFLQGSRSVSLTMRNVSDVLSGVSGLTSGPLAAMAMAFSTEQPDEATRADREKADAEEQAKLSPMSFSTQAAGPSASVSVLAGAMNAQVAGTATLEVPQGIQKVALTYNVYTAEYPYYVLSQSIFNDVWSLSVFGNSGQQFFNTQRNVNSQLYVAPQWQSNGSTGDIKVEFDVSQQTANGAITLTVLATAMNIGDSLLPTRVSATLSTDLGVQINSIIPDVVSPTRGDSSFYSIPRSGTMNHYARNFTLNITKPEGSTVKRVKAVLVANGSDLMTLLEEAPGANVQVIDDKTVRVRTSLHTAASTVASQPPPTHGITYRFELVVDHEGAEVSDTKSSGPRKALWRMPAGIARYGARDTGLDDWTSRGGYNWLSSNTALVTRVDDISGEHARDIGHSTHQYGTDIDMYHFYQFAGAVSGTDNYNRLRTAVVAAVGGDAQAVGQVTAWVTATREGLGQLLPLNTVALMYYAIGSQVTAGTDVIPGGWAQSLLTTGAVTTRDGQVLDTSLGAWTHAQKSKMRYNAQHNNHIHIQLNRAQLGD